MPFTDSKGVQLVKGTEVIGQIGTRFNNFYNNLLDFTKDYQKNGWSDAIVRWNNKELWVDYFRPETPQENKNRLFNK